MLIYGLMKLVESAPHRYDSVMNHLTFGRHRRAHDALVARIAPGSRVLDVGCGAGGVALACAEKGAFVWAVDSSVEMLQQLRRTAEQKGLNSRIVAINGGAASLPKLLDPALRFDAVVYSLMLGELSGEIRVESLRQAAKLLSPEGVVLISDELWPEGRAMSALYSALNVALFIPNFIFTRTMIKPVRRLPDDLASAGLRICSRQELLGGVITQLTARPLA